MARSSDPFCSTEDSYLDRLSARVDLHAEQEPGHDDRALARKRYVARQHEQARIADLVLTCLVAGEVGQ